MSVPFPQICGPSYELDNKYAAVEKTSNWYLLANESQEEGKFKTALEPSPGNKAFSVLPVPTPFNQPNRGMLELRDHCYGVNGNVVFELTEAGAYINIGHVVNDGNPCSLVANGNGQVFISSAGLGYVIPSNGAAGSLLTGFPGLLGAAFATMQDNYIVVVTPDSDQWQISGDEDTPLGDATKWSAANVSLSKGQADKLAAAISSREYLRIFGNRRTQVFQNIGNNGIGGFPFANYNQTFIETGIAAPYSLADLGESLVWIGQDARGVRACWRDAAFSPQRISNFAVEQKWSAYYRIDDARAYPMIWKGHLQYVVTFPSARKQAGTLLPPVPDVFYGATWVYDATVSELLGRPIWSERAYTDALGYEQARSEQFHCFAFGKHLAASVGLDGNPGAVYEVSANTYTDCGLDNAGDQQNMPMIRDRICPHIWTTNKRIVYNRLQFELSRGVGLDGSPAVGQNPQIYLRWSNDGGNTFGPEQNIPIGMLGDYGRMVYWNRLGYARDRVYWVRYSDPTYIGLVNASLDMFECGS